MHRARKVLLVAFVATALSADRMVSAAAPTMRPQVMDSARRLAGRLVVNLRRTVPQTFCRTEARNAIASPVLPVERAAEPIHIQPVQVSPFQFRLPPPLA